MESAAVESRADPRGDVSRRRVPKAAEGTGVTAEDVCRRRFLERPSTAEMEDAVLDFALDSA